MEFRLAYSTLIFTLLSILFLISLFKHLKRCKPPSHTNHPPGPMQLPFFGNMLHLAGSLPHHALRDLAKKYGPIMRLQLGEVPAIVISSSRAAEQVLKTHDISFANRPELIATKNLLYNSSDIAFAPYGDYWRKVRKICTLELLTAKRVRSFRGVREDEIRNVVQSIRLMSSSDHDHEGLASSNIINISELIFSVTNHVVCRTTFGKRFKHQELLIRLINETTALSGGFDVADLFPSWKSLHHLSGMSTKLQRLHSKFDQVFDNVINERREYLHRGTKDKDVEDFLGVLLSLQESDSLELQITSDNIKAILLDILTAGTDTSSGTVEWAMSELMRNPRILQKVQDEVRKVKGDKSVDENDIEQLSYLKHVIKETLRMHPPLPLVLPRECREQCEVDGYTIPIKTKVIVNAWMIGRDPQFWDNPDCFEPERFDNQSINLNGTNFNYIPFGAGRRMCPGLLFGLANAELLLAQLLYHFDWKVPDGMNSEDLDMKETSGSTTKRKNALMLIATPHTVT